MNKIRRGKDFKVIWSFFDCDGKPYLLEREFLTMYAVNSFCTFEVTDFTVDGNTVIWLFRGKDQKNLGDYTLELVKNNGEEGMIPIETVDAFTLVQYTRDEARCDCGNIKIEDVTINSSLDIDTIASLSIDTALSTTSNNAIANFVVTRELNKKQDNIDDLATIRSGAAKGATAVQNVISSNTNYAAVSREGFELIIAPKTKKISEAGDPVDHLSGIADAYDAKQELAKKVDKVSGKQLSTEDFTTALKQKLQSLNNYDDTVLTSAINSLQSQINTLVSGNASSAIDTFNEIIAFLDGVKDTQDLAGIIASIEQQIAGVNSALSAELAKKPNKTDMATVNGQSLTNGGNIVIDYDDTELREGVERNKGMIASLAGDVMDNLEKITQQEQQLTELSAEVTSILFEKGNVSYGNEVANDAVYRSLYIPCKKGDIINGKIYRVKVFDANYQYLAEEGATLNGALADYVVETADCAYVRIVILTRDKNDCDIYINGVNALYLIEKSTLENHRSIRESLKQTNNNLETKAELPCVFEVTDKLYTKMAVFGIKDMSIKAQEGWLYTIVLKNLSTSSQFSLYRAEPSAPRSLKYCGNFCPTLTSQRSGVEHYVATFSTGEKAEAIVDWDKIKGLDASAMYPDEYILKDEVFKGGLLSNNLIPQVKDIEGKVDALEGKVDALSVGGCAPKEKYWAVCGDSITNANHATIYDIAEGDAYMPIDGYPNLSTYKRKNYAYYIAQRNGLQWANYGWGGTTLSSVSSKAYGYKNAFVDDRMKQLADYPWDYISIFFGGNDSYFGPTHHKDKWLKDTYGVEIGYPINESQIGAEGFATSEQKAACDAVTGEVHGVQYNDNAEYFLAKFIGTINSTDTDTWYGALNTCVSYLLSKYGKAKIILIASYTPWSTKYADAVVAVAKKYGVRYYDFRDALQWPTSTSANTKTQYLPNVAAADEKWVREDGVKVNANVFYRQVAQYLYDGAHPTNRGYEEMSYILEDIIMG